MFCHRTVGQLATPVNSLFSIILGLGSGGLPACLAPGAGIGAAAYGSRGASRGIATHGPPEFIVAAEGPVNPEAVLKLARGWNSLSRS